MRKNFFLALVLVFAAVPAYAQAQAVLTEIMYDLEGSDAGREWVEIYNDGTTSVDLTDWKLFEANTNHGITAMDSQTYILSAGAYAVAADNTEKFLLDWPDFSGALFDSSFSLSNVGEALTLRDAELADVDSVTYSSDLGAQGDGNSLQKTNGSWIAALPTPGSAALASSGGGSSSSGSSTGDSVQQSANAGWVEEEEKKFTAVINSAPSGIAGADFVFEGRLNDEAEKEVKAERYFWNFGDGDWKDGQKVSHAFVFPGKYLVSFTAKILGRSVTAYREIEILENKLAIVGAKGGDGSWVKLSSAASQRLNLTGWILQSATSTFIFPEETYILPKTVLTLAEASSGLKLSPSGELKLLYPNGSLFQSFSYPGSKSLAAVAPISSLEPKIQREDVATGTPPEVLVSAETQPALLASFSSNSAVNWALGALGLGLLAALGFIASRRL
ncbi:MAG: lamin tail domain-containing protein [bacterium]|nr:lamin tail domain-containing protein [bacterium]